MSGHPFEILPDPARRLVTIKVLGFWTLEDAQAYVAQLRVATDEMRASGGAFDMLLDVGTAPPVARETAEYLDCEQGNGRPLGVRRMAFVCVGVLGRLQMRRLTMRDPDMAVFSDMANALAWLAGERDAPDDALDDAAAA